MRLLLVRVNATLNPIRVSRASKVGNRARKEAAKRGSTHEMCEPHALKKTNFPL